MMETEHTMLRLDFVDQNNINEQNKEHCSISIEKTKSMCTDTMSTEKTKTVFLFWQNC